ncbi:MAG TPA: hypothetical protein VIQ81_10395, partial [Gammaproteobacteria bacterium]
HYLTKSCISIHVEAFGLLSRINGFYPLNPEASILSRLLICFIPDSSGCWRQRSKSPERRNTTGQNIADANWTKGLSPGSYKNDFEKGHASQ